MIAFCRDAIFFTRKLSDETALLFFTVVCSLTLLALSALCCVRLSTQYQTFQMLWTLIQVQLHRNIVTQKIKQLLGFPNLNLLQRLMKLPMYKSTPWPNMTLTSC